METPCKINKQIQNIIIMIIRRRKRRMWLWSGREVVSLQTRESYREWMRKSLTIWILLLFCFMKSTEGAILLKLHAHEIKILRNRETNSADILLPAMTWQVCGIGIRPGIRHHHWSLRLHTSGDGNVWNQFNAAEICIAIKWQHPATWSREPIMSNKISSINYFNTVRTKRKRH